MRIRLLRKKLLLLNGPVVKVSDTDLVLMQAHHRLPSVIAIAIERV